MLESVKDTSLTGSIPRMSNRGSVPANSVLFACLNGAVSILTLGAHCCCLCGWLKEALQDGFIVNKDVSRSLQRTCSAHYPLPTWSVGSGFWHVGGYPPAGFDIRFEYRKNIRIEYE